MEGGPPRFRPGFTCPDLLRYQSHLCSPFRLRDYHPVSSRFPKGSARTYIDFIDWPYNPKCKHLVWALPTSLAATMGISVDFFSSAYLDVSLRQVSPLYPMYSDIDDGCLLPSGFPIRKPTDQCLFPAPRSLSQVSASFVASRCQGIHQQLLVT